MVTHAVPICDSDTASGPITIRGTRPYLSASAAVGALKKARVSDGAAIAKPTAVLTPRSVPSTDVMAASLTKSGRTGTTAPMPSARTPVLSVTMAYSRYGIGAAAAAAALSSVLLRSVDVAVTVAVPELALTSSPSSSDDDDDDDSGACAACTSAVEVFGVGVGVGDDAKVRNGNTEWCSATWCRRRPEGTPACIPW